MQKFTGHPTSIFSDFRINQASLFDWLFLSRGKPSCADLIFSIIPKDLNTLKMREEAFASAEKGFRSIRLFGEACRIQPCPSGLAPGSRDWGKGAEAFRFFTKEKEVSRNQNAVASKRMIPIKTPVLYKANLCKGE